MEDDLPTMFRRLVDQESARLHQAEVKRAAARARRAANREREAQQDAERAQQFAVGAKLALSELKTLLAEIRSANPSVRLNGRVGIGGEIRVRVRGRADYEQVIRIQRPEFPTDIGITFDAERKIASLNEFRDHVRKRFLPVLAREVAYALADQRRQLAKSVAGKTWAELPGYPSDGTGMSPTGVPRHAVSVERVSDLIGRSPSHVIRLLDVLGLTVASPADLVPPEHLATLLEMQRRGRGGA